MNPIHAIERLFPYKTFLTPEGIKSVEDTLTTFQLTESSSKSSNEMEKIEKNRFPIDGICGDDSPASKIKVFSFGHPSAMQKSALPISR